MNDEERFLEDTWDDPIVAEVRAAREALYRESGYDLRELCRRLRAKQALSSRPVVTRSPRYCPDREPDVGT